MSAARLEARLAALLSTPELVVGTGVAAVGGPGTTAAVSIAAVTPRPALSARLPGELLPRTPQRVSAVTVRAVLSVGAGGGADARAEALEAATVLWWRCEDGPIAGGSGFPAVDLTEGYRVLEVRPVGWTAPGAPGADADPAPHHRIDLDIDALVWPRSVSPRAGEPIDAILVRLGATPVVSQPVRLRVGGQARIGVDLDLRSLALRPGTPGDPGPAPRSLAVSVVPLGDAAAGSLADGSAPLTGDRAEVLYTAGGVPGRDELRFALAADDGPPVPVGAVPVEVTA